MIVAIRLPVAGKDSGVGLSIDGGKNYHPLVYAVSNKITTHFSAGTAMLLMYDANGNCSVFGTSAGATATSAANIQGVWRVLNLWTDGNTYTSAYCSTAASTAAKIGQCTSYAISGNHYLHVTIATTNTIASALTFNVNWQGEKPIYINGAPSSATNHNLPRGTYLVYYDGANYQFRTDGIIPGAVSSATALSSSAGSVTVPVYFSNGKPVAITSYGGTAATATKATQDESGNNIKSSYASTISIADHTITLKNKNGASLGTVTVPDTNTWRGIQNNLTSTSTSDSLAAAQGKILNEKIATKADYDEGPVGVTAGSAVKHLKICTIKQVAIGYSDIQLSFVISSRYCRTEQIFFAFSTSNKKAITTTNFYYDGPQGDIFKVCAYQKVAAETDIGDSIEIWCEVSAWNHMEVRRKECCTNTNNLAVSWNMELADALPTEAANSVVKIEPLSFYRPLQINGKSYNGFSYVDVGVIGASYGGSGKSSLSESANAYLNALSVGSTAPKDDDYYICQFAGGGSTTTTYHRRPVKALYTYMKGKMDSVYAAASHTHTLASLMGNAAKGSTTQPVYWTGSAWANTTYTLGANVPSNAKFTDTVYILPTASSTLGGVKTTSTVTEVSDYTACPIVGGVPYYRNVVEDNLNSKSATNSLSANQGRLLNAAKVRRQYWEIPIAANKWSRICYVTKKNWAIGSSYMINIAISGDNFVSNDLFVIKTHATRKAQITKISGSKSATYKIRVVSNDDGDSYVELFTYASSQVTALCTFIDMQAGSFTPYSVLTDGTTLPANFAVNATLVTNNNSLQGNLTWKEISDNATCTINTSGTITGSKVYGAVWNDYAEFRCAAEEVAAGDVVWSDDKGNLHKTFERMQSFEGVVSDTYGFAIGETDKAKTPLAVAGRVLVRTDCDRNSFHAGDVVCTGENGTVSKMTRNEVVMYPDRIVGTVSEIPDYETWGSGNIAVKNRIWIKVK